MYVNTRIAIIMLFLCLLSACNADKPKSKHLKAGYPICSSEESFFQADLKRLYFYNKLQPGGRWFQGPDTNCRSLWCPMVKKIQGCKIITDNSVSFDVIKQVHGRVNVRIVNGADKQDFWTYLEATQ